MKKPGTWMAVAASLALAGCSNEVGELREAIAPIICKVEDSDARIYEATNIEPVNALNDAFYQCTLAARDPTACREVACTPLRLILIDFDVGVCCAGLSQPIRGQRFYTAFARSSASAHPARCAPQLRRAAPFAARPVKVAMLAGFDEAVAEKRRVTLNQSCCCMIAHEAARRARRDPKKAPG